MKINYEELITEVLYTSKSISLIASEHSIYTNTLSKRVKSFLNIKTIDDIIKWCDIVDDTRKIISPRDKNMQVLWEQIINSTSFLSPNSTLRERLYYIKNNTSTPPKCFCGNDLKWNTTTQKTFNTYCSQTCAFCVSDSNLKRKQTNLNRRGVEYAYLDDTVREKKEKTMLERYGDINFNKSTISIESKRVLSNKQILQELYDKHKSTFSVASELGVSQAHISNTLAKHSIPTQTHNSSFEQHIRDYVESLGVISGKSRNIIPPQELDIYIPSLKLAFECDGLYWHSEQFKEPNYHLNKTKECEKRGIRLIHVFEHEFINHPDKVKSRICSLLGKNQRIYGRQCELREISFKEGFSFFEKTHIQGGCRSSSVNLGLFFDKELVACMSFSKTRYTKSAQFELIRYSTKLFTTIVGGPSKLFKAFVKSHPTASIVSYSDKRWNTGNLYNQLGFVRTHDSSPNYFYFNQSKGLFQVYSRIKFQKHKLTNLLERYDPNLTEYENMKNHGYERIWDCGNSVWIYTPNYSN
jgi:glutaredoxin/very-short-patch-repair endonuclease